MELVLINFIRRQALPNVRTRAYVYGILLAGLLLLLLAVRLTGAGFTAIQLLAKPMEGLRCSLSPDPYSHASSLTHPENRVKEIITLCENKSV